ncbi:acyltransferase family-domain-containing protein [Leptodontidium sp. MPI-SDFR-AT-0119]|nr:acyltransferase family-domain-containing protein [Leptodontidium sp. MPI-SDFR-AT-0119]
MAMPELDIATTSPEHSIEGKFHDEPKWASEVQPIRAQISEDGMSDETLRDMDFPLNTTPMSRCRDALTTFAIFLLPSPLSRLCGYDVKESKKHGATSYLDGMRGLASFCVFLEHVAMKYHPHMFEEYGDDPHFWQLPIIRLVFSGSVMVAIFFVISGFSLSLRPLELIYEKDWERLFVAVSSAMFRRTFRIILPPAVATFMIMLGVRMHLFDSKYSGAVDMDLGGPIYRGSFLVQVVDWLEYVFSKLIYPYEWASPLYNVTESEYAAPMYTIPKELWSSFLLFITITSLSRLRAVVRLGFAVVLIYYCFWCMRYDIGCFLCGMLMAEQHVRSARSRSVPTSMGGKIVSTFSWSAVLLVGFWLASIPHTHGSYGSHTYGFQIISAVIPWGSNVFVAGSILIVWAIANLPLLQRIFTSPILHYLGQISFALYLVHWPILAIWGWRLQPTIWKLTGNDTEFNHAVGFAISLVCITPVALCVADLFWRAVDIRCIKFAKRFETELVVTM